MPKEYPIRFMVNISLNLTNKYNKNNKNESLERICAQHFNGVDSRVLNETMEKIEYYEKAKEILPHKYYYNGEEKYYTDKQLRELSNAELDHVEQKSIPYGVYAKSDNIVLLYKKISGIDAYFFIFNNECFENIIEKKLGKLNDKIKNENEKFTLDRNNKCTVYLPNENHTDINITPYDTEFDIINYDNPYKIFDIKFIIYFLLFLVCMSIYLSPLLDGLSENVFLPISLSFIGVMGSIILDKIIFYKRNKSKKKREYIKLRVKI